MTRPMEQTAATTKSRLLRRATIFFFAGMAILTLFSNTIVNYSLPRVQVKNFESGMMFRQIQAEGTISAQLKHTVNFGAPRIVDQVKVEVGSPVLVGDIIATLKPTEGVELLEMEMALENAELALAQMKRTPASLSVPAMEKAVKAAQKAIEDAKDAQYQAYVKLIKTERGLEDDVEFAEETLRIEESDLNLEKAKNTTAESLLAAAEAALAALQADPNTEQSAIDLAQATRDTAYEDVYGVDGDPDKPGTRQLLKTAQDNYDAAKDALDTVKASLKAAQQASNEGADDAGVIAAQESLADAEEAYPERLQELSDAKKSDALAVKDRQTAITKAENDLEVQRAKFEQFKSTQGVNEIKADYEGRISKLTLADGATINTAEAVAVIDDAQARYDLRATIPAEQAQTLVIGDRADVSMGNIGWAQAILREIREDKDQPGVVKQLVFDVEGEVALGQQVSINIYKQGRNYDMIVPNAAIRQDASGSFVLAMRQKNGPLGSRYTLERVSVTILESDSTRSAISGTLDWGMPIVTAANKPVEAGSRVLPTK
ncbi:MAG: efflux RND transporter periplasmic adaptor subunit [Clostridia bacterium]|nr:efflux RND transporter periplasmic adaptor subunit [Clostridia bacterium]